VLKFRTCQKIGVKIPHYIIIIIIIILYQYYIGIFKVLKIHFLNISVDISTR